MNQLTSKAPRLRTIILLILTLSSTFASLLPQPAFSASIDPVQTGPAIVSVFSETYGTSNIVDTSLTPGSGLTVELVVANAPAFNGYDLFLYYDPNYLQAQSVDTTTGTVFDNPFAPIIDLILPGIARLAVVNLGSAFQDGSGTLVHITFHVTALGSSPLTLAAGMQQPSPFSQSSTRLVLGSVSLDTTTTDGSFANITEKLGPIADFTLIPQDPQMGDRVVFDATASLDPDNDSPVDSSLRLYTWDFGDGLTQTTLFPLITHRFEDVSGQGTFPFSGNFSVRLAVTDSDNLQGMIAKRVEITEVPPPLSDFALTADTTPITVSPGDTATTTLTIESLGEFIGTLQLSATTAPEIASSPTPAIDPSTIDIGIGATRTTTLTIATETSTHPGKYVILVEATSGPLTRRALVFVEVRPLEPIFVRGRVSWTHHLSLAANGNTQTWTAKISNPNPAIALDMRIRIFANTNAGFAFIADSALFTLQGGETRFDIVTTRMFTFADVGTKFTFTAVIVWFVPLTNEQSASSTAKSGSFLVVP